MEDQHFVNPGGFRGNSLFAVFDGHGGSEVSKKAKKQFEKVLDSNNTLEEQEWLKNSFLEMDRRLSSFKN